MKEGMNKKVAEPLKKITNFPIELYTRIKDYFCIRQTEQQWQ
jgi:hypothetical protein